MNLDPNAALYDLEVEFPKDSPSDASLTSVLNGIPSYGDIYIRKLPISEIPTDDEKQTADYLYNVFVHKVGFFVRLKLVRSEGIKLKSINEISF